MKTWRGGGVQEREALGSVSRGARLSPCLYLSDSIPALAVNGHADPEYTRSSAIGALVSLLVGVLNPDNHNGLYQS